MPNHVTTRCTITGDDAQISAFRAAHIVTKIDEESRTKEPYTLIDFDTIIPMPAVVRDVEEIGTYPDVAAILLKPSAIHTLWEGLRNFDHKHVLGPWPGFMHLKDGDMEARLEAFSPGCVAGARKMLRALGETGYRSWYDWSIANWGTKWNSYSFRTDDEQPDHGLAITFDTAWSFPTPVFHALAERYPGLTFDCTTFDEGWNFAGAGLFGRGAEAKPFATCDATDALYERVYGRAPEREEEVA